MKEETIQALRFQAAVSGSAVDVVHCAACGEESVTSPSVVAENGLPRRCPKCVGREIEIRRYRVTADGVEEVGGQGP